MFIAKEGCNTKSKNIIIIIIIIIQTTYFVLYLEIYKALSTEIWQSRGVEKWAYKMHLEESEG